MIVSGNYVDQAAQHNAPLWFFRFFQVQSAMQLADGFPSHLGSGYHTPLQ
jgi:hypothetical protein